MAGSEALESGTSLVVSAPFTTGSWWVTGVGAGSLDVLPQAATARRNERETARKTARTMALVRHVVWNVLMMISCDAKRPGLRLTNL